MSLLVEAIRAHAVEAVKLKILGNERLKNHLYNEARDAYIQALKSVLESVELLQSTISENEVEVKESAQFANALESVKSEIEEVRLQLISNLSLTELKLELWEEAIKHTCMVLTVDPTNAKALFRRAVARIRANEQLEDALADLKKLKAIDDSAEIASEIGKCKMQIKNRDLTDFQTNIRDTFKPVETSPSMMEALNSWFGSFSAVMAQCGGARSQRKRRTGSSK